MLPILWAIVAVAVTAALLYSLLKPAARKVRETYTRPGCRLLYYLRYARWVLELKHHQHQRKRRLNNYMPGTRDFNYCGVVPTPEEEKLEAPVHLTTDRHEDVVVIWGVDGEGRAVYARVARLAGKRTSVILVVRDEHGQLYTTPNQPDSSVCDTDGERWRGAGLLLECVQPMRTWRLKFNGFLRKGARAEYNSEVCAEDDTDVIEARMDMVWRALKAPVDLFKDSSPYLLAQALATEPDADLSYFTSLDRDAYDQQGALAGTLQLGSSSPATEDTQNTAPDDTEPTLWYLRGGRQHRWGMSEAASNIHRSVDLLNFLENGDSFYLHTFCYPASLTHCSFGYMQTAGGDYLPITACSFNMADVGEDGSSPSHVIFTNTAGGRSVPVCMKLSKDATVYHTGDPWTLRHSISFTESFMGENRGTGVAVFSKRFTELCPVPEQEPLLLQVESDEEKKEDDEEEEEQNGVAPLVAAIGDKRCRDPALAGGKGSSLAVLTALMREQTPQKFLVPRGITVTTEAWRRHLSSKPGLRSALLSIEKAVGSANDNQIRDACDRAADVFRGAGVCEEVQQAITGALQELYDDSDPQIRFAVRSSGCDEDGNEASAAGQNLTVLGTRGLAQVLDALPGCWASLHDYTSVQYRRQRGLRTVGEMAVVVQEMVPADVAGVIFTCNPTTGSPATITITANYGLGESVVSGAAEPDTITVRRSWRDVLSVASIDVGKKATRHVISNKEGTRTETVPEVARSRSCLDETLALRLASLALYVEKAFGSPRDIEFAVLQERLYLLQARPITSLESWSELELLLELDDAFLTESELLTRANTGEVFPGPMTPLTLSVVPKCTDLAMQRTMQRYAPYTRIDPAVCRTLATSHLHCHLNMMETLYRNLGPTLETVTQALDYGVFGHVVINERYHKMAIKRHGAQTFYNKMRAALYAGFFLMHNKRRVAQAKEFFQSYNISTERAIIAQALYDDICIKIPDLIQICVAHTVISSSSSFTQCVAFMMLAGNNKDISQKNVVDMALLLSSSCEGENSAGVPAALMQLASIIAGDEEKAEFLAMPADEGCVWLQSHPGRVGEAYQRFIDHHGHRCINELMLESLSWGMDSCSLVNTLQSIVSSPPPSLKRQRSSAAARRNAGQCLDNLQSDISNITKRALSIALPLLRTAVHRRETTKSYFIKTVDSFRRAYRTLGAIMVSEGRLPDADLVFYLQHYEIGMLLKHRTPSLISKATRRRVLVASMENIQLPEISEGRPKPIRRVTSTEVLDEGSGDGQPVVVRGTPVCLGKVRGHARVVLKLADACKIKSGDILITYSTDVGWTPYFPLLAGVVTEIGGLISHGAVVAREYGLPCVVGTAGATTLLRSGDLIELNGNTGVVTRISSAS
uniref:Phosphoenolpyruvate synthase n=1 Tax=Hirondellea gigas TaxID=1518452 RepID=A0A6A7FWM4_9CRUS